MNRYRMIRIIILLSTFNMMMKIAFTQNKIDTTKRSKFENKGKGQQYNNTGSGTQNIYNKTVINKKVNDSEMDRRRSEINATVGYFGNQKDASVTNPEFSLGSVIVTGNMRINSEPIEPIKVENKNGQLNIFGNIRDCYGNMIARLNGRSWEIVDKTAIEYNNDDSAFEIVSGGRVVFQVILSKDKPAFNGFLCGEAGDCMYLVPADPSDKVFYFGFPETTSHSKAKFDFGTNKTIKRIFKYPRYEYYRIREEQVN